MKTNLKTSLLAIFLLAVSAAGLRAGQLDIWTWRNPVPTANQLYGVTHGLINGSTLWVVVGANSTVLTSSDYGSTWSLQAPPSPLATLNSVAYSSTSANHFVAVGSSDVNGNDVILFSPDGTNWTAATVSPPDNYGGLFGVACAYANGDFMAVGFDGYNYYSADGQNWTENLINFAGDGIGDANGVAYGLIKPGNPGFVAVGDNGVSTTVNLGFTPWITNSLATFLSGVTWNSGSGEFVAVGYGAILNSPDGVNWYETTGDSANAVVYGNGQFVAVSKSSPYTIYTSPGGATLSADTWTPNTGNYPFAAIDWDDVNGNFVAVGPNGTIATSYDGTHWQPRFSSVTVNSLNAITYGANASGVSLFMAGGINNITGGPGIFTSPDGYVWTLDADSSLNPVNNSILTSGYVNGLASGNLTINNTSTPEFVGLVNIGADYALGFGAGSVIISSSDGATWNVDQQFGIFNVLNGIAYGNNEFVAVGVFGTAVWSSDPSGWTSGSGVPGAINLNAVAYGNVNGTPTFVAVGQGTAGGTTEEIYRSTDGGNTWTAPAISSPTAYDHFYYGVAFGNNPSGQPVFVAVGYDFSAYPTVGDIWTSLDGGQSWSQVQISGAGSAFSSVTFASGFFVATTGGGTVWVSPDGAVWTQSPIVASGSLYAVASGDYQFIAVGNSGAILGSVLAVFPTGPGTTGFNPPPPGSPPGTPPCFWFDVMGPPGPTYGVYVSTDLMTWNLLQNVNFNTMPVQQIKDCGGSAQAYYYLGPPSP